MALTTTDYDANPFPLHQTQKELPSPPDVAITPCDPWPRPYYIENGLRRVAPYHYTYNTFCKQRWRGREILDIFAAEFRDRSREYYKKAIEDGQIVLNGTPCRDITTIVQNGDVVSHTLHRHEPPVTAQPIRIIAETDNMIVIDKPAGVPVHPAGRYKFNSVIEIMRAERHYTFNPLPCNRLDRLTSGVMFVSKTASEAEAMSASLRERTVRKEYVARVKGRFSDGEGWDGNPMRGGVVKCEEPILQISPVLGLNRARASGKSAKTLFRRIAYYPAKPSGTTASNAQPAPTDSDTEQKIAPPVAGAEDEGYSIVHCLPLTGRTHQIRVHLQFLGHPISNDPIYSNHRVFGPTLGKADSSAEHDAAIIAELSKMGKTEVAEAFSYSQDEQPTSPPPPPPQTASTNSNVNNITNQTQQITFSDLSQIEHEARKSPTSTIKNPIKWSSDTNPFPMRTVPIPGTYKPLNSGTLHAGSIPLTSQENTPVTRNGDNDDSDGEEFTITTKTDQSADPIYNAYVQAHEDMVATYNKRKGEKLTGEVCPVCDTPLYSDPGPQELGIYLHALAYSELSGAWKYRSHMPEWAKPPLTHHFKTELNLDGPTEVDEWVYEGVGAEGLDLSDEEEKAKEKNVEGMVRNKGKTKEEKRLEKKAAREKWVDETKRRKKDRREWRLLRRGEDGAGGGGGGGGGGGAGADRRIQDIDLGGSVLDGDEDQVGREEVEIQKM